jgi:hypothetical protein
VNDGPPTLPFDMGAVWRDQSADRPAPEVEDLTEMAEGVRNEPRCLVNCLSALRENERSLRRVAARSYLHSNGFAKIILRSRWDWGTKLRLHVWDAAAGGGTRGESDPHGHRWAFASTVVAGDGLDVVHFEEVDEAGPGDTRFQRYEYDPRSTDAMHPRGSRVLRTVASSRRGWRDVYGCDTDVIHTIEPSSPRPLATLVVQGPDRTSSTPVYRRRGDPSLEPRLPLTAAQLTHFATIALNELGVRR